MIPLTAKLSATGILFNKARRMEQQTFKGTDIDQHITRPLYEFALESIKFLMESTVYLPTRFIVNRKPRLYEECIFMLPIAKYICRGSVRALSFYGS